MTKRKTMTRAACMISLAALMFGCSSSDDDTSTSASATTPIPAGTLRVTVKAGPTTSAAPGTLVLAPYLSCPPAGPPVGLKFSRVDAPKFPTTATLTGLDAGTYHVLAYVGAGMQPAATDPQLCSTTTVTLTASAGAELEVTLP